MGLFEIRVNIFFKYFDFFYKELIKFCGFFHLIVYFSIFNLEGELPIGFGMKDLVYNLPCLAFRFGTGYFLAIRLYYILSNLGSGFVSKLYIGQFVLSF